VIVPPRPVKPPVSVVDLVVSIMAIVLTAAFGVVAAAMGVFLLAFLDHCPPETCSAEGAATAVWGAILVALVVGVLGSVATIVALVRRKPAWPWAVGSMVSCGVICVLGLVGYFSAVGA
jgi:hypothetical protein